MYFLLLVLCLLKWGKAQGADCDYIQEVEVGRTYFIYNPNYPKNYPKGTQCRWIATCPEGYHCKLTCPYINIPQTENCQMDQLLVSKTGDPQLVGADRYCGRGSLTAVSKGQRIIVGLIASENSKGGKFRCNLVAQMETPSKTCQCGEKKRNRIVGGQATGVNEYKMMAGLVHENINQIKCGAVIISQKHLLTAAHCVYKTNINDIAVIVGEHNVTTGDSAYTKAYRVAKLTPHPKFSESNYDYDIAIVTTTLRIEYNEGVGPVCLPFKFAQDNFAGDKVTVLGWGTLYFGGPDSEVLMKVDVDVISQNDCKEKVPALKPRQMCTYTPGKDACQDDSGGPLLYTDPSTGLLFQVGIVSYGRYCASTTPGVNTRVTELLQWIVATTKDNFCVK